MEFAKIRHLKKNEYLLKAGEVCSHGYFINKGILVITFLNQKGKEVVQGFYIDEDYAFITEIISYFSKEGANFQIKVIEDCEVFGYSKTQLDYLVKNFPEFAVIYNKVETLSFQNLYMFSAMRLSLNAEDFLIFLYKNHPIYMKRLPDKYIAKFMGISKEWLSKLKKKVLKNNFQNL